MKVGIVGLGLIGGSIGLKLKSVDKGLKILGYDHNIPYCEEALSLRLVDEIVSFENIKKCDIIFLAIPVESIITAIENLKDIDNKTTIIELGGTKLKIVKHTPRLIRKNLIYAHPMAGTEYSGPKAATLNLFDNRIMIVCDEVYSGCVHVKKAIKMFEYLNVEVVYMNSKEHDIHASFISHLPHTISFALANTVMKQEDPKHMLILAASGFKDMSRLAKSSPKMWSDIFKQNRENLLLSINLFQKELEKSKNMIEKQQWDKLHKWIEEATILHNIF